MQNHIRTGIHGALPLWVAEGRCELVVVWAIRAARKRHGGKYRQEEHAEEQRRHVS